MFRGEITFSNHDESIGHLQFQADDEFQISVANSITTTNYRPSAKTNPAKQTTPTKSRVPINTDLKGEPSSGKTRERENGRDTRTLLANAFFKITLGSSPITGCAGEGRKEGSKGRKEG